MNNLVRISEETIREIIAKFYNIKTDDVCLYHDYRFILKNGDKVREDFIYGIVEKQEDLGRDGDGHEENRYDTVSRRAVELRINEFLTNETYTEEMLRDDIYYLLFAQSMCEEVSPEEVLEAININSASLWPACKLFTFLQKEGYVICKKKLPKWLNDKSEDELDHWTDKGSLSCRCSACGCKSPKEYPYCPNCGTPMEKRIMYGTVEKRDRNDKRN